LTVYLLPVGPGDIIQGEVSDDLAAKHLSGKQ
jgi:hypothetical protein